MAIDDFGTGFSSLRYLLDLPLTTLKIDKFFINNIHHSKAKYGLVKGVVDIANSLSISCIAKGVETPEQQQALSNLSCYKHQGYLYSKPLSFEELIDYLA